MIKCAIHFYTQKKVKKKKQNIVLAVCKGRDS